MNIALIKNAELYTPKYQGSGNILIINDKIAGIGADVTIPDWAKKSFDCLEIDAKHNPVSPGLIDTHVHVTGGGGEAGFHTQVPPLPLSVPVSGGITTLGGLLGTDGVTRHLDNVLAKACSLEEEGLSTFMITGGYPLPSPTLTGSIQRDFALIHKVRGGKVAIADHRVPPVSALQLARLTTDVRVGGMLRGFIGMLIIHIGASKEALSCIFDMIDAYPYLTCHLIVTHINRSSLVFGQAKELARRGGFMDISSGLSEKNLGPDCLKPAKAILAALNDNVPSEHILMSSDGYGSAARYDDKGNVEGLTASDLHSMFSEVRDLVLEEKLLFETALQPVTGNAAKAFSLYPQKGALAAGSDADILIWDKDYTPLTVFARGQLMMKDKELLVHGTFEK